jgi:NhaA family Na+:H+ antiporter
MTIPARTRLDRGRALLRFEEVTELDKPPPADPQRHVVTRRSEGVVKHVDTPLQRLEHALHPWVSFVIIPIFALANAGVAVGSNPGALIASPVAIGVLTGLVVGKPVGIVLASWLSVRTGLAKLPHGVKWSHMIGVGFVAGIGFTMSLFITGLAFPQGEASMSAKVGILLASTVAGFIGWVILRRIAPSDPSMPPDFAAPGRTLLHRGGPKL